MLNAKRQVKNQAHWPRVTQFFYQIEDMLRNVYSRY